MKRVIDTNIWEDEKWCESITSPKARLLWFYLLTSPNSKSIGIFQLNLKKVAFDTGLLEDEIKQYLMLFTDLKMCVYFKEDKEIIIWNYPIYNICSWGKPMQDKIRSELSSVKSPTSIEILLERLQEFVDEHQNDKRAELMSKVIEVFKTSLKPIKERETLKESKGLSKSSSNNNSISNSNYNDTTNVSCSNEENNDDYEEAINPKTGNPYTLEELIEEIDTPKESNEEE